MKIILKYLAILCAISLMATACMKSEQFAEEIEGEEIILSLSPSGEILQVTDEPLKADLPAGTLYVISVYNGSTRYAHGVFSDPSAMSIRLSTGKEYFIQVKAVKDGVTSISNSESVYDGNGLLDNTFHYYASDKQDDTLYGNTADVTSLTDQWTLDTYYGALTVTPTASTSTLAINLYRMMHGINVKVLGFQTGDGSVTFTQASYLPGTESFTLTPSVAEFSTIAVINPDFATVLAAISGESNYTRTSSFTAVYSGTLDGEPYTKTLLNAQSITFRRNRLTTLTLTLSHNYHNVNATITLTVDGEVMDTADNSFGGLIDTDATLPVPEAVDLGLSVKWASFNLGASAPEEYGNYYAWGETEPKESYTWENYKFRVSGNDYTSVTFSRYCPADSVSRWGGVGTPDDKTEFSDYDYEDDAARVNLGSIWRTPTDAEWTELRDSNNCSWTWTSVNNENGYLVTSKKSGYTDRWIFLPAAGLRSGMNFYVVGSDGYYWSASLNPYYPESAWRVTFSSDRVNNGGSNNRSLGFPVRPVTD